jgi:hypothetical protein
MRRHFAGSLKYNGSLTMIGGMIGLVLAFRRLRLPTAGEAARSDPLEAALARFAQSFQLKKALGAAT